MISCDPNDIQDAAKCFCFSDVMQEAVEILLLCSWVGNPAGDIFTAIAEWQSDGELIAAGGLATAEYANNASTSGVQLSYLEGKQKYRIKQAGEITRFKIQITALGTDNRIKFKVFRQDGYPITDFVSETPILNITSVGENTFNLVTPLAVQAGDLLGWWQPDNCYTVQLKTSDENSYYVVGSDITGQFLWSSSLLFDACLGAYMNKPFAIVTGDSIAMGYPVYASFYWAGGPFGNLNSEPGYLIQQDISATMAYQNHAMGAQTFAWVNGTAMPYLQTMKPKAIVIHCGVNDVNNGRTWPNILSDLNAIKAQLLVGQKLFLDEILPWTAGSDANALTIRTFNANMATWCAANDATLVQCHDPMGQIRPSTGQLDDLKAAYNNGDGVHLNPTGDSALAQIVSTAMINAF